MAPATASPAAPPSPPLTGDDILRVDSLVKRYGSLTAVDGITFGVHPGETFGLLGPNGAGKTTTLEMIEGLRRPDSGRITLLGRDAVRERAAVQQRIGVQLQSQALWPELTVEETLKTFRALFNRGVPLPDLLDRFGLNEKRRSLVRDLSGGQKQRLSLATALVNDPEIVFLDEPTTGLDPQARHAFWDLVQDVRAGGKTVIITTHYMEEANALCERVAIMDRGQIIAVDAPRRLVQDLPFDNTVECTFQREVARDRLQALPAVRDVRGDNGAVTLFTSDVSATVAGLMRLSDEEGHRLDTLQVRTATLEDVFMSLTGRRLKS
ncbi:MAG: ABC transporter ATP-binding protein [Dehalococcoidia bacterium]